MARVNNNNLRGKLGPMVHYLLDGQPVVRALPKKYRRTKNSVHSGRNFGLASTMGSLIRAEMHVLNPARTEKSCMYRLTGALNKFLRWKEKELPALDEPPAKIPFLQDFQFNELSKFTVLNAFSPLIRLSEEGNLEIGLPAMLAPAEILRAPEAADHMICHFTLIGADWTQGKAKTYAKEKIIIPKTPAFAQPPPVSFALEQKPGELLMLVMTLQYIVTKPGMTIVYRDDQKTRCGIAWLHYTK